MNSGIPTGRGGFGLGSMTPVIFANVHPPSPSADNAPNPYTASEGTLCGRQGRPTLRL